MKSLVVRWKYIMVTRTIITYGTEILWNKTTVQGCKVTLDKLQRATCIAITGAFKTAPKGKP
jgi:hypothetical protein